MYKEKDSFDYTKTKSANQQKTSHKFLGIFYYTPPKLAIIIIIFVIAFFYFFNIYAQMQNKIVEKKIRQDINNILVLDSKELLSESLKSNSRDLMFWLSGKFASKYSQEEVLDYYKKKLMSDGWSVFEHEEFINQRTNTKVSDIYKCYKDNFEFSLSFISDYNLSESLLKNGKDIKSVYNIYIGNKN